MTAHQKLMEARIALQGKKLAKTGKNKFAGYSYFELGDFLPTVQEIFLDLGLCGVISYGVEKADLTICDVGNPEDKIIISSPMSSASLKGAHDIQNLGAVQTYLRRYLWVTAMEIVEHDALDAVLGSDKARDSAGSTAATTKRLRVGLRQSEPSEASVQSKLDRKLRELGIIPYGLKTVLKLTEAESVEAIPESKAMGLLKAVGPEHVKMFNQGKNSKGVQIIPAPVKDQLSGSSSIDELAKAADEAFGDD
jgi:hypothetical protein